MSDFQQLAHPFQRQVLILNASGAILPHRHELGIVMNAKQNKKWVTPTKGIIPTDGVVYPIADDGQ